MSVAPLLWPLWRYMIGIWKICFISWAVYYLKIGCCINLKRKNHCRLWNAKESRSNVDTRQVELYIYYGASASIDYCFSRKFHRCFLPAFRFGKAHSEFTILWAVNIANPYALSQCLFFKEVKKLKWSCFETCLCSLFQLSVQFCAFLQLHSGMIQW
jgi:hypothetical protein